MVYATTPPPPPPLGGGNEGIGIGGGGGLYHLATKHSGIVYYYETNPGPVHRCEAGAGGVGV